MQTTTAFLTLRMGTVYKVKSTSDPTMETDS
jgi:hypothetical protein